MQNNDLISRSAAIAEIEDYIEEYSDVDPETGLHSPKWCAMEEAKDVLVKLPAAQTCGWISVEDELPKVGDLVLFTGLSSFGTRFITQRGWFDGTFWKRDAGETVYSSTPVTHWMPLPSTEGLDET